MILSYIRRVKRGYKSRVFAEEIGMSCLKAIADGHTDVRVEEYAREAPDKHGVEMVHVKVTSTPPPAVVGG